MKTKVVQKKKFVRQIPEFPQKICNRKGSSSREFSSRVEQLPVELSEVGRDSQDSIQVEKIPTFGTRRILMKEIVTVYEEEELFRKKPKLPPFSMH